MDINILKHELFPLSNKYDPVWIMKNQMGPHPLWLTEFLVQAFDLKPGMRVLDLACGKGMTSVFLAKEFGVQVCAVDFDQWEGWTSLESRWDNAKEHGVQDLVIPIKADAQDLPFAPGFFDTIVCINSYMYFGQDETYLENILKFLRPGGQIGFILTSYVKEITDGIPDYIHEFLGDELWTWKTLLWWKNLWKKSNLVSIDTADPLPDGCALWLRWEKVLFAFDPSMEDESDIFEEDLENGEYMGFIRLVATKK